jgi:class 3 adenylate cyclase/tetratricopeptide (TPR) repeat protein/anti-anti-sigma regulatory factor
LYSTDRVQALLQGLRLSKYAEIFRREEIDDDNLHQLTEAHLRAMGIPLGPALKIINALQISGSARSGPCFPSRSGVLPLASTGEHRQITVLYCDLVQSTELTHQLGNERYATLFAEYVNTCERMLGRYGQEISEQKGDGIGVCFGLTKASEDDVDHAVRAAIDLKGAVSSIPATAGTTLRCRIGIATGPVAVVSSDAFGDVMNLASRLQDLGAPGDIIVDSSTRRICGDAFTFIDVGYRHLKGFGPQRVWRLGGSIPGISRFEATRGSGLSPLTGRDHELMALREHWRLAREGEAQLVFIEGDAGIGKSRLVREFMAEVAADHRAVIQSYHCILRRQSAAYYPIIDQWERSAGIQLNYSAKQKLQRIERLVSAWGTRSDNSIQVLAALLGLEEASAGVSTAVFELPDQTLKVFTSQLKGITGKHALLVVFEDVHWIDSSTADLLVQAMAYIRSEMLPILLVLTHRPIVEGEADVARAMMASLTSEASAHNGSGGPRVLKLSALRRYESYAIIEHIASGQKLPPSLLESIASRADDVPLFVEEVTKYVLEFGRLRELENYQPLLLERIQPYLTGRLDGLGREAKEVAQVGSVIGRKFTALLVSRGLDRDAESLQPALDHLVQSELVHKQGDGVNAAYAFKHALVQDAAYGSLFQKQKRTFHRRIGEALEREYPELAASEPDVLAWHFTEAEEYLKAITYWRKAGEAAITRSAMAVARRQFEHGRELVERVSKERSLTAQDRSQLDSLELDLLADLGIAVYPLEGSSDKRLVTIFERVLELASKQGRPDREFDAHLGLSNYYYVGGDFKNGDLHIQPCLRLADQGGDPDQLVSAHRIAGELAFYVGDLDRAIQHLRRSIERYDVRRHSELLRKLGDDPGALARMYLAISLWLKGENRGALKQCEEGIAIAEQLGHDYTLGQATFDAAWLHAIARNYRTAKEFASRSIKLCSNGKDEFRLYLGCSTVIDGWVAALEGNVRDGITAMRRGMPLIEDTDAEICLSCFLPWLAEGLARLGEIEEGLKVIRKSHESASERFYDAERLRIEGELRARHDRDGAKRCFQGAIETSRKGGMKNFELRAALALCKFQVSQGEKIDPQELLGHLLPWINRETPSDEMRCAKKLLVA